jgi:hypothetical protein
MAKVLKFGEPYTLKFPVPRHVGDNTETIRTVTLRRPTGADLLLVDEFQTQPMRLTLEMIAALGDLELTIVKKFDGEDVGPLAELALSASPNGAASGATV